MFSLRPISDSGTKSEDPYTRGRYDGLGSSSRERMRNSVRDPLSQRGIRNSIGPTTDTTHNG